MTGFKDRLKDALSDFVEFDENAPVAPDAHLRHVDAAPAAPAAAAAAAPTVAGAPRTTATDPEMLSTLEHAVARSTTPGYTQFVTLYAAMDSVPDERLRYDVTLKALRASYQLGPDAVLAAIEDRLRLLDDERTRFEQALAAETERSVDGTTRQIATVTETIATKQAEIRELEAQQARLHESALAAQAELDRSRAAFGAAYATVHGSLDAERARIAAHLASGK